MDQMDNIFFIPYLFDVPEKSNFCFSQNFHQISRAMFCWEIWVLRRFEQNFYYWPTFVWSETTVHHLVDRGGSFLPTREMFHGNAERLQSLWRLRIILFHRSLPPCKNLWEGGEGVHSVGGFNGILRTERPCRQQFGSGSASSRICVSSTRGCNQ